MDFQETKCTLRVPQLICDDFEERSVDFDILLPDYCPDVTAILKSSMSAVVTSRFQSGDRYSVDGKVFVRILYISEDRKQLYCYEAVQPFGVSFRSAGACHHDIQIKNDYLNCRAISPRRMDVHGAFRVYLQSLGEGSVTAFEDPCVRGVFCQNDQVLCTIPLYEAEKGFFVDESIDLSMKADRLLYSDFSVCVNEQKLLTNKMIVKGTLMVKAVYCVDGHIRNTIENIPFSQIVDVDGLTDQMHCETSVSVGESETHLQHQENGGSVLVLNCKLTICVRCSVTQSNTIVKDMYSVYHPLICETTQVRAVLKQSYRDSRVTVQQNTTLPDGIVSVEDVWGELKNCEIQTGELGSTLNCCLLVCMIAKDHDGLLGYYERMVDCTANWSDYSHAIKANLLNVQGTVNGESLRVQAQLSVCSSNDCDQTVQAVCGVSQDDMTTYPHSESAIRIVYANKGDHIWEVAKQNRACMQDIMAENDLQNEILQADSMLMIPMV